MQWINAIGSYFNVEQKKAMVLSGDLPSSLDAEDGPPVSIDLLDASSEKVVAALGDEKAFADKASAADSITGAAARFLPDGFSFCRVTRNSELVDFSEPGSKEAYKSTRFLEFDLAGINKDKETVALKYVTGDHAKIMPSNSPDTVNAMCTCLRLSPDQWVEVKVEEGMGRQPTAPVGRVQDFFTFEIDLATQDSDGNLPLFQRLLEIARNLATTESETLDEETKTTLKDELDRLDSVVEKLSGQGEKGDGMKASKKAAITDVMEKYLYIPSILSEFPVTISKLSLADCVEVLPPIKPRYYSIASSSELHPGSLQLTVGVLTIPYKKSSLVRLGMCSNHLAARSVASTTESGGKNPSSAFVRMGVNTSSFRLPADLSCPVIMVGPGTGISPMMGFLQAREKALADGKQLGPCMVFFGCRTEADFLHREQMRAWESAGVITSLQVAFSRLPTKPKEYVQHRISVVRSEVWDFLKNDKCHYYVCGDSNMAEDVYEELFRTVHEEGGMGHKDVWQVFQKMKTEHRFQNDTWGVVSNREEGLAKQAEKKYNQAANWLQQVTEEGL